MHKRKPNNTSLFDLEPGDYCKQDSHFRLNCPDATKEFPLYATLSIKAWAIEEHPDGTITIPDSIRITKDQIIYYHYRLRKGTWIKLTC